MLQKPFGNEVMEVVAGARKKLRYLAFAKDIKKSCLLVCRGFLELSLETLKELVELLILKL